MNVSLCSTGTGSAVYSGEL